MLLVAKTTAGSNVLACCQINFIPNLTYQGGLRLQIEGVRVHQNYRSKGLGAYLIDYVISLAQERRCCLVQLTCDKKRSKAHRFYQQLGFVGSHEGFKLKFSYQNKSEVE